MNIKNHLIVIGYIAVMFIGLGIYTNKVIKDILVEAIKTETTKVINTNNNDLKTKIHNNFKKISELNSNVKTALPIKTEQENTIVPQNQTFNIPEGYSLINDRRLSRKLKKEKERCKCNVFH